MCVGLSVYPQLHDIVYSYGVCFPRTVLCGYRYVCRVNQISHGILYEYITPTAKSNRMINGHTQPSYLRYIDILTFDLIRLNAIMIVQLNITYRQYHHHPGIYLYMYMHVRLSIAVSLVWEELDMLQYYSLCTLKKFGGYIES